MRLFRIFALHLSLVALGFAATHRAVRADEHQPQKWALLVGTNDYAHLRDLRYASRDMLALGAALTSAGFPREQVVVFHDDAKDAAHKPLKANIERHLSQLTRSIKKGTFCCSALAATVCRSVARPISVHSRLALTTLPRR